MIWLLVLRLHLDENFIAQAPSPTPSLCPYRLDLQPPALHYPPPCDFTEQIVADAEAL